MRFGGLLRRGGGDFFSEGGYLRKFKAYALCFTVNCRMADWCLRPSSNGDFDWSIGTSCTETEETGPCNEANIYNKGELRWFST